MSSIRLIALLGGAVSVFAAAQAQNPPAIPDAAHSDPRTLGLMQGFPPAPDKKVQFGDGSFYKFPALRWSFNHERELAPTKNVWRGEGQVSAMPRAEQDLNAISFKTLSGEPMTVAEAIDKTYTDGFLVLHRGKIVTETYRGAGGPHLPHTAFSVTKSFVGTLAAMLIVEGKLDPAAPVTQYVPELASSAYGDATVRQVLDMTIGVHYTENYTDPNSEVWAYAKAGGMLPIGPDYKGARSFYDFLVTLKKEGEHGSAFAYKTSNAEVLAWIVKRASGESLAELLSSRIWSKLGAEDDAYFTVDSIGTESGGGGLNTTLRDLARFGEMIRNKGSFNGQQVLAPAVIEEILKPGDKAVFAKAGFQTLPGWSYRDMWWVSNNEHGAFAARGIHGQSIYIDPKAEMVIVRYASNPAASNVVNDPITLPAYAAIADALMAGH